MSTPARHHVVVGGSAAGVAAAFAMREHGFDGRITLVDSGSELPYERPPLSKSMADLDVPRAIRPEAAYYEHGIDLELGSEVTDLDAGRNTVRLNDGRTLHADAVVLASGVSARRLPVPGVDLDNVLVLRDVADARRLAERMYAGGPLVLLGGGFIGLEAAAVARERGVEVTVVEVADLPLKASLGHELANLVVEKHRDRGVQFRTAASAAALRGCGAVEAVELRDGTVLEAATVLIGCGVTPNDGLARRAGVYVNEGIVADGRGRTSNPWIWAAGDVVNFVSRFTGRRQRIEHWDVAQRQGTAVGANLAGKRVENIDAPYFWSDQFGDRIQMFGRARPGDQFLVRGEATPDAFLGFWVRDGWRLVAAAGMNQGKELRAAKVLIETGASVQPEELADPSVSLRALGRRRDVAKARLVAPGL